MYKFLLYLIAIFFVIAIATYTGASLALAMLPDTSTQTYPADSEVILLEVAADGAGGYNVLSVSEGRKRVAVTDSPL